MRRMLYIQSRTPGVLCVNGQFCGPLEGGGQAFPMSRDAEVYVQLFPFSRTAAPLTAALILQDGAVQRLEPQDAAYALLWPDGVVQLDSCLPASCGRIRLRLVADRRETAGRVLLGRWDAS